MLKCRHLKCNCSNRVSDLTMGVIDEVQTRFTLRMTWNRVRGQVTRENLNKGKTGPHLVQLELKGTGERRHVLGINTGDTDRYPLPCDYHLRYPKLGEATPFKPT
ncbi:hypothetical protein J6590_029008 [Homalodisca vitripennis]|nr:hypothetical protein J6590_029008 [Homalodisca vitripennis]